jgi:F420-dependent oxidoreductase-like protein
MRIALMVEGQEGITWEEWLALARAAEEAGIEALFRSDHYRSIFRTPPAEAHDAWTSIAAAAAVTNRIRFGTMVSPVGYRHPALLARVCATADRISGGRIELGIGSGWYEREYREHGFVLEDGLTRFSRMEEQVEIVIRSWTEDQFSFSGEHYRLEECIALPKPAQRPHPPLILGGAARPRAARLAARWAQEYNIALTDEEECRLRRAALDEACREQGREPGSLVLSLTTRCTVGADRAEARERLERVRVLVAGSESARMSREEPWLTGTADEVLERMLRFEAAGVDRIFLHHLDHRDLDMVHLIGREIASAITQDERQPSARPVRL